MTDILHLIPIHASRDNVYRAIATAEGIRNWFSRDADLDTGIGGSGEIRFANRQRVIRMKIDELAANGRVVWGVLSAAMPTWSNTRIEFEMSTEGDGTMLHFAHRGFAQSDDFFAMSATAWGGFLLSLKQYVETGQGTPHPDDALSRAPDPKRLILGNHAAVFAARSEQARIRKFYGEVLGCEVRTSNDQVDRFQLDDAHFCFVWQDAALDENEFLKSTYLELKADKVEEMKRKILDFGVRKLDVPDAHLYFQAPGGQVFRLVGIGEDLSAYEGSPSANPGSSLANRNT
ncbi:MAG TPA: SRPBCC domain-containing protein [Rhodanobacteraceae bacterium]|nr:SRPBCC domain-containing protein [Rhodanobacteraceae bacterium]